MKANCYECQHRGSVPGSRHSSCHHPSNKELLEDPLYNVLAIFGSVGRYPPVKVENPELNIRGNTHGIRMGWFNWPANFDPTWLDNCDGFLQKGCKNVAAKS